MRAECHHRSVGLLEDILMLTARPTKRKPNLGRHALRNYSEMTHTPAGLPVL